MTTASAIRTAFDTREMRRCLEPMIADALGSSSPIRAIRWSRFELATSYNAHVATIHLESGQTSRVFVKDFGSSARPKEAPRQRREREVRVYRDLLEGAELGTARYYGSVLDEEHGHLWLLLEFVDGTPVGYLDIDTYWAPAAVALGRLHAYFASNGGLLASCDFLVHHSRDFFWSKVELAARCVDAIAPARNGELAAIVKRYSPVVDALAEQPRTLINGGCRPTNILVRVVSDPSRTCIIDWEEAAYGAPLYDLAYLLDGIEPPMLDPLLDAYRHEALAGGLQLPAPHDMKHVIDCFRLHMIMVMLGHSMLKGYTANDVGKLLGIGDRIGAVVFRRYG